MSLIARDAGPEDLEAIYALARQTSAPLTNLPPDRALLSARIEASAQARSAHEAPRMLVVEREAGEVIATATLKPRAGEREVYYTYRRETLIHASQQLDVRREVEILSLSHEMSHATLLCALAVADCPEREAAKTLLRAARLALIQAEPERFASTLFVALPGYQADGLCPFWEGVGRHFFSRDFSEVHREASLGSKSFIGEVMPPFPLYVPLLEPAARQAIAAVHPGHQNALRAWQREGFVLSRHVDLLDGGALLEMPRERLAGARSGRVVIDDAATDNVGETLVVRHSAADFRAMTLAGPREKGAGGCRLSRAEAARLGVEAGETVVMIDRGVAQGMTQKEGSDADSAHRG